MQGIASDAVSILLVEDNPGDARLVREFLQGPAEQREWAPGYHYELQHAKSVQEAHACLNAASFDVILLDLGLPDSQGLDTLRKVQTKAQDCPVVVLTVENDNGVGLHAVRQGAQDYLVKAQLDARLLPRAVFYAIERSQHQKATMKAHMSLQEAKVRAEAAERARNQLEREVAERRRAEAQVRKLNAKLTQRLEHLRALYSIDKVINASMNLDLTLQVVLQHISEQLGVDAAVVLLSAKKGLAVEHAASRGFHGAAVRSRRIRLGEGTVGRALLEHKALHYPDLAAAEHDLAGDELVLAEGFTCYHAAPLITKQKLRGVLEVFHRSALDADQEWLSFFGALAEQAALAVDNATLLRGLRHSNSELASAYDTTIEGWARALDLKDEETAGHSQRVTEITVRLARHMGIGEDALVHVRRGALLHDIGKMGVPDSILLKPGALTDEEWIVMKQHTTRARELLSPIHFLQPALDIPTCHHEKWDGNGYPQGLKGDEIPQAARIFAVVDVYDALTSDRPYRKAWSEERALAHIQEQSGKHFDPAVVEAFMALMRDGKEGAAG